MNDQEKSWLYLELAKLTQAGFGMRETATTVLESGAEVSAQRLMSEVKDGLEEGKSIAEAFHRSSFDLTEVESSLIEAGERSGRLGPAFEELGAYFELLAGSRREIVKSLIYPAFLLHLGILLTSIPFAFGEAPSLGAVVVHFLTTLVLVYVVGFIIFLVLRCAFRKAPEDAKMDRLLSKIPLLGKARKNLALARFTKVYHGAIISGLSMQQTVAMSARASHSGMIQEAGRALSKQVDDGHPLGPVFQDEEVFPSAFSRSYLTAEKAGSLDQDLERWGEVFAQDARASAKRLAVVGPQVLYALVVIYIGWKIVSFYSGYYGQIEEALDL